MKFSRISVTKKGVELDFENKTSDATEDVKWSSHHPPLASFNDAMQGLVAYVVTLLDMPITFHTTEKDGALIERLTVTTVNLSEDKNGLRGLVVTAILPVEKAYNKPLVLNTPLVREGGELALDEAFVLSDEVLDLIDLIEIEATRYKKGEHGEPEAKAATSENTKNADQKMAEAEVASTRKPKGKGKGKKSAENDAPVGSDLTDAQARQLFLTVDRDVPIEAITAASVEDRSAAIRWAELRQKEITGQLESVFMPVEPEWLIRVATPPLPADGWTEPTPVRVSDEQAQEIVSAGRAD